ncbi:hypothetical protein [Draconibacterium orientale]|nr:hypothetical protein [Draconibacterium orientale]
MKAITKISIENLKFEVLDKSELNRVRGGVEPPKTRDKDIYDFEED